MISDKKFIKDIYSVQKFQNYFQPYVRILITLTVLTALLSYIVRRTGGLLGEMINPYTRILMIITASTAVIFLPYILFMLYKDCLLYTSDAADERSSVDLGGRRLIKQKKR